MHAGSLLASILKIFTQGDRFASCENIVSRSQASSLPPPVPPARPSPPDMNKRVFLTAGLVYQASYSEGESRYLLYKTKGSHLIIN